MVKLFAYLGYADAPRALEWLTAIGFVVVVRIDGDDGTIQHAEAQFGGATVMIASDEQASASPRPLHGRPMGSALYLEVDDVDGLFSEAVAAGGHTVIEPEDTEWGGRRARVLDPEGNAWSFGTYRPGAMPTEAAGGLRVVPLLHVDAIDAALALLGALGAETVALAADGDFARLRFPSGDEVQVLGHPPNPEQDAGLVELTAVVRDLDSLQSALSGASDTSVEVRETDFGRQAIVRIPGGPLLKLNEFPSRPGPSAA